MVHLGIHHQMDYGALTMLQDNIRELQVRLNARSFPVAPLTGAPVINIGDVVQVWSNDLY